MIQANELRIGNVVNYLIKDELDERKEWYDTHYIDVYDIKECVEDNDVFNKFHKPIRLTEEILFKCGFKDIYNKMWLILEGSPNIEINKSTFQVSVWETINDETEGIYLNNIRYLHQLQNLYFALTGKELEINL